METGNNLAKGATLPIHQSKYVFKNKPTVILDAGHGGIIDNVYQTQGKRSPVWEDGRILYEGEFNRAVVKRVKSKMDLHGFPYIDVAPTERDTALGVRTSNANIQYEKDNNCFYLSVHANAGGGTGHETFTYKPKSKDPKKDEAKWEAIKNTDRIVKSEQFAKIVVEEFVKEFSELKNRGHKRANYAVVRDVKMPSFLIECAFMDTLDPDCELLFSEDGRDRFAEAIFSSIVRIYELYNK